ncbi:MAG TPA: hypothetical protein VKA61_12305, partial [Sphingomicrobium sp.]|nr:hypothetical protein [Sphingomicrobium sp.]
KELAVVEILRPCGWLSRGAAAWCAAGLIDQLRRALPRRRGNLHTWSAISSAIPSSSLAVVQYPAQRGLSVRPLN